MDRLAPTMRPADRPAGFQRWRTLLFLHWEVAISALRPLIPAELEIDTWGGRAYIGVVPFTMLDVAPRWAPPVPGISDFHELNVRTYVHAKGQPGVWFFSLDAAKSIAVVLARTGWGLPYHRAKMSLEVDGARVRYTSKRRWPEPLPADLACEYTIGEEIGSAEPDTFEHFLVERYLLFAKRRNRIEIGQVHHRPYPLRRAEVISLEQSMVTAAGLPNPEGPPHVLYCEGVDVDVYALKNL